MPSVFLVCGGYMTSDQAFEILGIYDKRIDEASLKRAFHEAARNTHPDSNPRDQYAPNRFYLINEAYNVLCEYLKYENKHKTVQTEKKTTAKSGPRPWEQPKNSQTKQSANDRWDYYNRADKLFREEQERQARKRAESEINKKIQQEKLRRERERRQEKERQQEKERKERILRQEREYEKRKAASVEGESCRPKVATLTRNLMNQIRDALHQSLFLELVLVFMVTISVLYELLSLPFVGYNKFGIYSRYIAIAMSWVFIVLAARKITVFLKRFFTGKLELIISFLILVELGLSLLKLGMFVLEGVNTGLSSIIIIVFIIVFQSTYMDQIRTQIHSSNTGEKLIAGFLIGEYLFIVLSGIMFGIVSWIKA